MADHGKEARVYHEAKIKEAEALTKRAAADLAVHQAREARLKAAGDLGSLDAAALAQLAHW